MLLFLLVIPSLSDVFARLWSGLYERGCGPNTLGNPSHPLGIVSFILISV